jgi:hypothetical protein
MILISRFHETGERIKMKLFKKALVATAVVGAFGAQAVTVSSDEILISQQGTDSGLPAIIAATSGDDFVLDFVVDELTPSASTITLTFDGGVDLSNINVASEDIDNNIGVGQGEVNLAGANDSAVFGYGTGSFTFDKFKVNTPSGADHSIEFKVNLGNPLTASSAFRLTLSEITNGIDLGDSSAQVCYKSVDASGGDIEEGCSPITQVVSQFAFDVTQEYNGKIERVDQKEFSRNYTGSDVNKDLLKFTLQNNESLVAALPNIVADVTLTGVFTDRVSNDFTDANATFFGSTNTAITPTVSGTFDEITFTVANGELATEGANGATGAVGELSFNAATTASATIPQTGAINFEVSYNDGTAANVFEYNDAAGSWALDATVINVPYLPLLFTDTTSSVHIANDGNSAANIMATIVTYCDAIKEDTCVDQTRSESVDLGTVPANTVAKIRQGALADAFGITEATKVSVTFNIDAYAEDISAYATVQNGEGRTEVSNSQAKVDGK